MVDVYFAYGSNMSTRRLQERIDAARPLGRARMPGWRLVCNKQGRDESGKANLMPADGATAWGVLFELPRVAWPVLDRLEGGYRRESHPVWCEGDRVREAQVYLAIAPRDPLEVFDWYRDWMIEGAREHGLPGAYVRAIESLPVRGTRSARPPM